MQVIADIHLHSKYSRATSKYLDIANLEKYGKIKGINLIGTGDFTHPKWIKELKANLTEDGSGILKTKTGFDFLLQTEVSLIYSQGGKGRRVHNIILAPDFDTVEQITDYLLSKGRIDYDGRPIFKIPCPDFVESLRKINKKIEVIPAHIWTPWFSLFGSMSGFDKIEDAFQDQTKYIHALETGLSSDPAMNWRISALDKYTLVSNSDSHSFWPWRLGREANIFNFKKVTYDNVLKALHTRKGFERTIEVDPNYGKYHLDGHRNCNVKMNPTESNAVNKVCPVCKKPLTIGVLNRIEELADREEGFIPKNAIPFSSLLPLSDILSAFIGTGVATKKVWETYNKLLNTFDSEMDILLNTPFEKLKKIIDEKMALAIIDNREGKIKIEAGYDGEYGYPLFDGIKIKASKKVPKAKPSLKNN